MKGPAALLLVGLLQLSSQTGADDVQWDSNHIRWDGKLHKYVPVHPGLPEPHNDMSEKYKVKYLKEKEKHNKEEGREREVDGGGTDHVKNEDSSETRHISDLRREEKLETTLNRLNATLEKVKVKDELVMKGGGQIDISATRGNFSASSNLSSPSSSSSSSSSSPSSSSSSSVANDLQNMFASTASSSPSTHGGMAMTMTMAMTFTPWTQYRVTLLFDWLVIDSPFEFFIAWLVVAAATILMHGVKYANLRVEASIAGDKKDNSLFGSSHDEDHIFTGFHSYKYRKSNGNNGNYTQMNLRIIHSVLGAIHYGLSLLLMLVAMTFNSALFVALIIGYLIGDYIFYHLNPIVFDSDGASCH